MVGLGYCCIFQKVWMCAKRRVNSNLRNIIVRTYPCARPQASPCISSLYHQIRNTKHQLASACDPLARSYFGLSLHRMVPSGTHRRRKGTDYDRVSFPRKRLHMIVSNYHCSRLHVVLEAPVERLLPCSSLLCRPLVAVRSESSVELIYQGRREVLFTREPPL